VSRGSVILYKTMRSSHLILIREFRFKDEEEDEDANNDQVLFVHCAHAQIRDSDVVTMLLQSTSSSWPR